MGRKKKPAQQQKNEGDPSKRGVHVLDGKLASEPKVMSGLPPCPGHLVGRARDAWMFWSEELKTMKLDKRPDGPMLEGACWNYARAVQAELMLVAGGLTVEEKALTKTGDVVVLKTRAHPAVGIVSRAWTLVRAFCSEFGLSPASRAGLTLDKDVNREQQRANFLESLKRPRGEPAGGSTLIQ